MIKTAKLVTPIRTRKKVRFKIDCTMSINENEATERLETHVVNLKLPTFCRTDPRLWFVQIEAQFAIAKIRADDTKFNYVISAIDTEILMQVADYVEDPPNINKYNGLKTKLIDIFSESKEKCLRKLLSEVQLGDKKPSQLLNEMSRLGGRALPNEIQKALWMQRLPTHIQSMLLTSTADSLENIAKTADRMIEIESSSHYVAEASTCSSDMLVEKLANEIAELRATLRTDVDRQRRYTRRLPKRKLIEAANGYCWYHTNFKEKATRCRSPCNFSAGNANPRQ